MTMILLYGLFFLVGIQSATVSILTDNISSNSTNPSEINVKNVDVFRQLLNQETLIRITLVKNVHALMKDMLTLQENLAKADNKISSIQATTDREISELKKQVEWLKRENNALRNNSVDNEKEVISLKENLKNVVETLNNTKVEVRYLSITLFSMDSHSKEINEDVQELKNWTRKIESEIMVIVLNFTGALSELETRHLKYIGNINGTTISLKTNIDQYEINQLKMSAAISSLELFRVNQTQSKCDVLAKVGFTTSVSSTSSSWNSGTLVFPTVITNVGNGYNPSDGVFTAPVAGVYVFFVNVQSHSTYTVYVDIVLNGATKVRTMAYNNNNEGYEAGPNLAVLSLQKGDRVWVKNYSGQSYYYDGPITTFSGFII